MDMRESIHQMKLEAPAMAASPLEQRNRALELIAQALEANAQSIFAANEKDMASAAEAGVEAAALKYLSLMVVLISGFTAIWIASSTAKS